MSLIELAIDDLRCIERAELLLHPGHNLIWGGNGSGKTSLLEAIFLLGRGRSFRTRNSERLIRYGRDRLVVFGRTGEGVGPDGEWPFGDAAGVQDSNPAPGQGLGASQWVRAAGDDPTRNLDLPGSGSDAAFGQGGTRGAGGIAASESSHPSAVSSPGPTPPIGDVAASGFAGIQSGRLASTGYLPPGQPLGVRVSRADGTIARIAGANAKSLTELTQVFPVQIIDPGIHKLVEEGGHRRRRWMDWAVFHVEHQFGDWWVRYTRAVKQRNAALRSQPGQAGAWDSEVIRLGELIATARGRFIEGLLPYWREAVTTLSGLEPELHYFRGWAQDVPLAEALAASRSRDETKKITHPGPHRADVIIRIKGRPAREVLSRGQQKLVAVAMTLAQLHLLQNATQTIPTLLLDDPAAELDGEHLKRFIDQVLRLRSQLVLTSLHPDSQLFGTPNRVFHVEQGRVLPV